VNGETPSEFERELRQLINRHSGENASHTPDFVLANYLIRCMEAWKLAVTARDSWYGFKPWAHLETPLPAPGPR
jgi:hypothetical protein